MDFVVAATPVSEKLVWKRVRYAIDKENLEIVFTNSDSVKVGVLHFESEEDLGDFLTELGDQY